MLRPAEAPLTGHIPGLRGREAVQRVIDQLCKPLPHPEEKKNGHRS